jgi:flagellar basal-body rod modification protein FlgD
MMEISNARTTSTPQTGTPQRTTGTALASDFETFLKMLTAQARYQDPLEPIDSSEYAAQLAQFSMVEQQVLSNDLLTGLTSRLGGGIGEMASWIGMEARTTAAASFDGAPVTVLPQPEAGADAVTLVVYGRDGKEVDRRSIPASGAPVEWDGKLSNGSTAQAGDYTFQVESRLLGTLIGTSAAQSYTRITEVRQNGTEPVLVLSSGDTVASSDVTALRAPTT